MIKSCETYLLPALSCLGFTLIFYFSAPSSASFFPSHYEGTVLEIFQNSISDIFHLRGGYWITVRTALCFLGMVGFIQKLGEPLTRLILRDSGEPFLNAPLIFWPLVFSLGFVVTAFVWLALGMLGLFYKNIAYLFFAAGLYFFFQKPLLTNMVRSFKESFQKFLLPEKIVLILLIFWVLGWATTCFTLETFWDSLGQHLGLPWKYIQNHRMTADPYNVFSYYFQNVEMLFTWALLLDLEPAAKLVSWFSWVCMIALVYGFTRKFTDRGFALIAASLFSFIPATYWHSTIAKNDSTHALFLLGSFLLWSIACSAALEKNSSVKPGRIFLFSGILLGGAIGTKYFSLVALATLAVLTPLILVFLKQPVPSAIKLTLLFLGGSILSVLPWAIKNIVTTGSPFYPYFCDFFNVNPIQPWHASYHSEYDPGSSAGISGYIRFFKRAAGLVPTDYGRTLGPLLAVFIFAPLTLKMRDFRIRALWIILGLGWFTFSLMSLFMRYKIVYIGLICILASIALFHLSRNRRTIRPLVILMLYGSLLWHPVRISLVNLFWPGVTRVLLGAKPDLPNFYEGYYREVQELYQSFSWIDNHLPNEVKVLFVGERRIYKMPRPFIASSDHDEELLFVLALKEPDSKSIRQALASLGVTHLLINVPGWSNYLNSKTEVSADQRLNLEDFFHKYVGPIITSPSKAFTIARLIEPGPDLNSIK